MATLVIGLGNPILGDDGVGWRVAEEVARLTAGRSDVRVETYSLGGLSLMEHLAGSTRAILIDSIATHTKPIGTISNFPMTAMSDPTSGHMTAAHDTSLRNALNIGRRMDLVLPDEKDILVVAIEAESVYDFSEELSPAVEASVPLAVHTVMELLDQP